MPTPRTASGDSNFFLATSIVSQVCVDKCGSIISLQPVSFSLV